MQNLKQKTINGVIWNLIEKIGVQLIKLVLGVILARLLTPEDYGLIGMITVFFAIAMVFIDSGFSMAFIQKKEATDIDASTIFYFNLIISVFFYGVMWFVAPLIASFYELNELILLIRVLSIIMIINSFGLIQFTKLKRDVDFKKMTIIILVSALLSGIAGITAALLNYGVWSLIIQQIVSAVIKNIGLWVFHKWRPLRVFSLESLKSMLSFSIWALLKGLIKTIFNNIYVLVIGKYFSPIGLGFYSKADQFRQMILYQTSDAVGVVAFPVFSKKQDDKIGFKKAMQKLSRHTMFFIAPAAAIFIVIAEPFFLLLLTEKWVPMVPYFQLMMIAGVLYPIHLMNAIVLNALAKMKISFYLSILKNSLRIVNIVSMYRYGIEYILLGEIILSLISLIINTFYTKKFIDYGVIEQLKDLAIMLLLSIALIVVGTYALNWITNDYVKIVVIPILIGGLYLLGIYLFNKDIFYENVNIIKDRLSKDK